MTGGSLSAARADEEGDTRFLQTDASVHPGSSGGPMLDEDGYLIGVVKMKFAAGRTAPGPGFGVPVNLVKDFLEGHGLLSQLPTERLRRGVVHGSLWKKFGLELPDGLADTSPARLRLDSGDAGGPMSARVDRVATPWTTSELEEGLLRGRRALRVPSLLGREPAAHRARQAAACAGLGGGHGPRRTAVPGRVRDRRPRAGEGGGALPCPTRRHGLQPEPRPEGARGIRGRAAAHAGGAVTVEGGLRAGALPRCYGRCHAPARGLGLRADDSGVVREGPGGRGRSRRQPARRFHGRCARPGLRPRVSARETDPRLRRFGAIGQLVPPAVDPSGRRPCGWGVVLARGEETLLLEAEAPEEKAPFVRELFDDWVRQVAPGRVARLAR